MNGLSEETEKKPLSKDDATPHKLIHKSSTKKFREPIHSPKKNPLRSKGKPSNSEINVSSCRKSTEGKDKGEGKNMNNIEKKEKSDLKYKKDKRCIEPTEKIVERINNNLQILQAQIHQLFQEEIQEEQAQVKLAGHNENKGVSSLVFKKNGSTLSLTKNNSKKRLEGRLTHDGIRSDRKYGEMGKTSKVSIEPGWK